MRHVAVGDVLVEAHSRRPSFFVVAESDGSAMVLYETYVWVARRPDGVSVVVPNVRRHKSQRHVATASVTRTGRVVEVSKPFPRTLVPWDGRSVCVRDAKGGLEGRR